MNLLQMFEFASSEIGTEIMSEIRKLTPCFGNESDMIYEGYVFEDVHPDNNPNVKYSDDALITLNDLRQQCVLVEYVKIYVD
jgi:hypothetical protein